MSANEPLQFLQLQPGANAHNVSHNAVSSCEILHLQVNQDRSHSLLRDSRFHDARKNFRLLGWLLVYQPWSYIKTILSLLVGRDIRFFPPPLIAGKTLWFSCLSRTFCLGAMFAAAPADDCSGRAKVGNSRKSQVVQTSKQNNVVHMPGAVNRKTHFDQRGCSQQLLRHSAAQASQLGSHQEGAECYRLGKALHAAWEKRANDHSSSVFLMAAYRTLLRQSCTRWVRRQNWCVTSRSAGGLPELVTCCSLRLPTPIFLLMLFPWRAGFCLPW